MNQGVPESYEEYLALARRQHERDRDRFTGADSHADQPVYAADGGQPVLFGVDPAAGPGRMVLTINMKPIELLTPEELEQIQASVERSVRLFGYAIAQLGEALQPVIDGISQLWVDFQHTYYDGLPAQPRVHTYPRGKGKRKYWENPGGRRR